MTIPVTESVVVPTQNTADANGRWSGGRYPSIETMTYPSASGTVASLVIGMGMKYAYQAMGRSVGPRGSLPHGSPGSNQTKPGESGDATWMGILCTGSLRLGVAARMTWVEPLKIGTHTVIHCTQL